MDNLSICSRCVRMSQYRFRARSTGKKPSGHRSTGSDLGHLDREERRSFIGGSDANVILSGDAERILRLWREKRGEAEPEDLSSVLPVMLGCWTEPFNRQWFEQLVGRAGEGGGRSTVICPEHGWRRCTLDGVVEAAARYGRPSTPAPLPRPRRCSSATCPSSSTTWPWLGRIGQCSRSSSATINMR